MEILTDVNNAVRTQVAIHHRHLTDQARSPHIAPAATVDKLGENFFSRVQRAAHCPANDHDDEETEYVRKERCCLKHWKRARPYSVEANGDDDQRKHDQRILPIGETKVRTDDLSADLDECGANEAAGRKTRQPTQGRHPAGRIAQELLVFWGRKLRTPVVLGAVRSFVIGMVDCEAGLPDLRW